MVAPHPGQRVLITNVTRIAMTRGRDAALWLHGRLGVISGPASNSEGFWVRLDERLPVALAGKFPAEHPLGRNVLLFPWEFKNAHDHAYAPFHRVDFEAALDDARNQFDSAFLTPPIDPTRPESTWWCDVTQALRDGGDPGVWEHVYRFGVEQRPVTLLIYSTVSTNTEWSRPAGDDAIRFVYERRREKPTCYLSTATMVHRVGLSPLIRVVDRIQTLLEPSRVGRLKGPWSRALSYKG